jgi:uncharacterized protein YndB with AHSA1/START domain
VISVVKDADARTMTITARFDAPVGRVWQSGAIRATWSAGGGADVSELAGGGTQMDITTTWASVEAMEQMLATGMEAGMSAAVGQIDELLGLPARA